MSRDWNGKTEEIGQACVILNSLDVISFLYGVLSSKCLDSLLPNLGSLLCLAFSPSHAKVTSFL